MRIVFTYIVAPFLIFTSRIMGCIRFYSRLPVPRLPWESDPHALPDFRTLPQALPLASLIIALIPALVLMGAFELGFSAHISAGVSVASMAFLTGGFHEDGLADVADGFGGGLERERRLVIMQDSRVGAFGAAALALVLLIRVLTLGDVGLSLTPYQAGGIVIIAAILSRTVGLLPLALLPPARPDGFSAKVGRPSIFTVIIAMALTVLLVFGLAHSLAVPLIRIAIACLLALITALFMTWLSWHKIQGQTGDVAGAAQQLGEIAVYMSLLIAIPARFPF
jgi:adenosylcobinamide-GDP ribazoletransferase